MRTFRGRTNTVAAPISLDAKPHRTGAATIRRERRCRMVLACSVLFLAVLSLPSRLTAAATGDGAKAILEKASQALGEKEAWKTRVERGLFIEWDTEGWGTLRAAYTRYIEKPDKMKIDQDNSAYDHPFFRTYYYNAGEGWAVVNLTVRQNPQLTANLRATIEKADGVSYYLANCDTFFTPSAVPDDSLLSGKGLERAGCVLKGDSVLFDVVAATNLPARRIENKGARTYLFDDYRQIQGREVPFHVTVYDRGKKTGEFLWNSVAFDEKLDNAIFEENRPPKQ
jgi:hypothetical protein